MNVGIVGLGLIGGSLAKSYKDMGNHRIYGFDCDRKMLDFAMIDGTVDHILQMDNISKCELLLLCIYPEAVVEYLRDAAPFISANCVVIDCCGTKLNVCADCFAIAKQRGFTFIGGHPMAGTQYSGYKYSKAGLFKGAYMIIVPPVYDDMALLDHVKQLLEPAGFGHYSVISAEKHDQIIAFTSQLAHIVSNAYVKSPTAKIHKGFSAGSYKDLTRVAWLNEAMWSELCMENRENVLFELDHFISEITKYRDALADKNAALLKDLFAEGKIIKNEIDG